MSEIERHHYEDITTPSDSILNIESDSSRELIEQKHASYERRYNPSLEPEQQLDTLYKKAITEALIQTGRADTATLARDLKSNYKKFNAKVFYNAVVVIADYIKTGGENNWKPAHKSIDNKPLKKRLSEPSE